MAKLTKLVYSMMVFAIVLGSVMAFGAQSVKAAPAYDYQLISQSAYPATLAAGATTNVWIEVKNTGTATWGSNIRLGAGSSYGAANQQRDYSSEFANSDWGSANRPTAVSPSGIIPGWHARFQFNIKAPMTNGTYKAYFTPVADGVTWMKDIGIFWQITVSDGTTPPPVVPPSGSLTVSLASDTPAAASIITSAADGAQALVPLIKLNFANGSSSAVNVTNLNLTRGGIAADADLTNMYLYDGNTRLAEMSSVANKVFSFVNSAGLFSIPANSTKAITVKADLAGNLLAGRTISLSVAAATDVVDSGTAFTGSFPINGATMTTAVVTDIGRLTVAAAAPTAPASIDPGVLGREVLGSLSFKADSQNLRVSYIKFTNVGTIANTDMANIKLMYAGTQLGSTLATLATDNTAIFDLSAAPLAISSGATKNLSVVADLVGGTNRSFKLTIQRQSDIVAMDTNYNIYVKPYTNAATETFGVIQPANSTSVNAGSLAVSVDSASPTGNVALNSTNIELARFKFIASGEAVKVVTFPIQIDLTTATNIQNVKLLLDGSQVGTTQATAATGTAYSLSTDFGNSFVIPAGLTGRTLSIRADISSASGAGDPLANNDTIVAKINAATAGAQGQISYNNLDISATNGRTLTVAVGTLSAIKNLAIADGTATNPNGVKGVAAGKIGSFVLTAGSGEGVTVSQIALTDAVTSLEAAGKAGTITAADLDALNTGKTMTVASSAEYVIGENYKVSLVGSTTAAVITVKTKPLATTFTYDVVSAVAAIGSGLTAATIRSGVLAGTDVDTLADTFQNLKLMQGSTQVGTTISTLTDTAATSYTFTPATSIAIAAGQQAVFDIYADVKTGAITQSVNFDATNGIINVGSVTATGAVTSSSANYTGPLGLQGVYIAGTGSLAVSINSDSPVSQQVIMGATGLEIARFKLDPGNIENLNITQIVVTDTTTAGGSLQNLQLYDGSTLLGTVSSLSTATNGTATFSGLNLSVLKGVIKVLSLKADVSTYPNATSASTHIASISAFTGTGASSGASLATAASTGTAGTMTAYRTKLTVAHASDSPSGASSGANGQTVAKFVVSNSANVGGYEATLTGMELNLGSTISWAAAATPVRYVTLYKNSISGAVTHAVPVATGNALGAYGFNADVLGSCTTASNLKCSVAAVTGFSNLTLGAANFIDVAIGSGSSVTIIVTADTGDAVAARNFSAGLSAANITWSDGVTAAITSVDSLPITGKTLTY